MRRIAMAVATLLTVGLLQALVAAPAMAADPSHVGTTIEGCKPGTYNSTTVLCANGDYTTGNLGKSWNELDLVPYRITLDANNAAPATQTYTLAVALDAIDGGHPGYDFLSTLTKNTSLSTGGAGNCAITVGPEGTFSPGIGGTDTTRFRDITITQAKNTVCVFDWYGRLAVGSHLFAGSSLHANLLNAAHTTAGIGASDVSIPVKEISPQAITKDMTASANSTTTWSVTKSPTPASLNFGDICDTENFDGSLPVSVTVNWTKIPGTAGAITVTTHVYATNPAHRAITTSVSDVIYNGANVALDTATGSLSVPANTTSLILTHTTTVPAGTTGLHDVATASYTDTQTGIAVPGQTTATASANVQVTTTNNSAVITDTETITGSGLSFSVDSKTGDGGSNFGSYVLGTDGVGPVTWTSSSVTASGSATFNKTVNFTGANDVTGSLDDTATVTGSDGFTASQSASVDISADSIATLTINKTTSIPVDGDTDFVFNVTGPGGFDSDVTVTILDGETSGSNTLGGLDDGDYTLTETESNGFTPIDPVDFTIEAGQCAAELDVENTFGPATAQVTKVTIPEGAEAGWTFDLYLDDDGTPGVGDPNNDTLYSSVTTTDANAIAFPDALVDEGNYYILESAGPDGFVSDGGVDCTFTVNYPADADGLFSCTFTNRAKATATVQKVTVGEGSDPAGFEFTLYKDDDGTPGAGDPNNDTVIAVKTTTDGSPVAFGEFLDAGDYYVLETDGPDGYQNTASDGCVFTVEYPDSTGLVYDCSFTNAIKATAGVVKVTDPAGFEEGWEFTLYLDDDGTPGAGDPNNDTVIDTATTDATGEAAFAGKLDEGDYYVLETEQAGWESDGGDAGCTFSVAYPGDAGTEFTCTFTNTATGTIKVAKTGGPAGQAYTFELREDVVAPSDGGTLIDSKSIANNNTPVQLNGDLALGTYTVCEIVPTAGWSNDMPNQYNLVLLDNEIRVCTDVTLTVQNQDVTVSVANTPPPGGERGTLGYWKNHASCKTSKGKQAPVLDQTLKLSDPAGIPVGTLVLHGGTNANLSPDCLKAIRLLDKSRADNGAKQASDPIFGLAAQYLAAKLNMVAGASTCAAANTAVAQAQALFLAVNFNGSTHGTLTNAQKTQANTLAGQLDAYNNGGLC